MRPGEKFFEELSLRGEEIAKTRHPKIYIGNISGRTTEDLDVALARMSALAEAGSAAEIRDFLTTFLPEARLDGAEVSAVEPE
jgi:FlaA1/EpsC-like NDP-sugar epimerase